MLQLGEGIKNKGSTSPQGKSQAFDSGKVYYLSNKYALRGSSGNDPRSSGHLLMYVA